MLTETKAHRGVNSIMFNGNVYDVDSLWKVRNAIHEIKRIYSICRTRVYSMFLDWTSSCIKNMFNGYGCNKVVQIIDGNFWPIVIGNLSIISVCFLVEWVYVALPSSEYCCCYRWPMNFVQISELWRFLDQIHIGADLRRSSCWWWWWWGCWGDAGCAGWCGCIRGSTGGCLGSRSTGRRITISGSDGRGRISRSINISRIISIRAGIRGITQSTGRGRTTTVCVARSSILSPNLQMLRWN